MSTQMSIPLGDNAAELAKDEAMARVYDNADPRWINLTKRAIKNLCQERMFFSSDDVWARVPPCREPRALGPILKKACNAGLCKPTGRYVNSKRVECHGRPILVYESLIFGQRNGS
jgi:hypothetical protein